MIWVLAFINLYVLMKLIVNDATRQQKYFLLLRIDKLFVHDRINKATMGVLLNDLQDARTPYEFKLLDTALTQLEDRITDHSL